MPQTIYLKGGEQTDGSFDLGDETGAVLSTYGPAERHLIDNSKAAAAGSWTSETSGTYDLVWTHAIDGTEGGTTRDKGYVAIYPVLADQTDRPGEHYARISATPSGGDIDRTLLSAGEYAVHDGAGNDVDTGTNPVTITVKPLASGDPTAGNPRFRVSYYARTQLGASGLADGIDLQRGGDKNALELTGAGTVRRGKYYRNTVHAVTCIDAPADGVTRIEDCIGFGGVRASGSSLDLSLFPFVIATPQGADTVAHFTRVGYLGLGRGSAEGAKAFYSHAESGGGDEVGEVYVTDCWAAKCQSGVVCEAVEVTVNGFFAYDVDGGNTTSGVIVATTDTLTVAGLISRDHRGSGIRQILQGASGTCTISESHIRTASDATANTHLITPPSGVALTVERCLLDMRNTNKHVVGQTAGCTVNRCIIRTASTGRTLDVPVGYVGDNNLWLFPGGTFRATYDGSLITKFADDGSGNSWQERTGQDANSVCILGTDATDILDDTDTGDMTLDATILAAAGSLTQADVGPTTVRTAWPVVPLTEDDVRAQALPLILGLAA